MKLIRCIMLAVLITCAPGASDAQSAPQDGAGTPGSILGVSIGATREQVAQALEPHGTSAGRATRDGGRKDAWTLRDTDFTAIAVRTNKRGEVIWVNAFVRPERELPFSALGDVSTALQKMDSKVVWQGENAGKKFQLIASGKNGRVQSVLLLAVE